MKATSIKQVLKAARWILDNVGWCQGNYYQTKDGKVGFDTDGAAVSGDVGCACAIGCIYLVEADFRLREDTVVFLENLIDTRSLADEREREALGIAGWNSLADWNDQPNRTKAEVHNLFTKGIKKAK